MPPQIALGLQLLLTAMELFQKLKLDAQRTGELTPEQELELDRQIAERMSAAHWSIQP